MKISKRYRPELVVSKGKEPNPLLTDPFLDAKEKRLVSTDGRGLVALPVETEKTERSRYLACSLLQAARGFGSESLPAEIHDQEVVEFGVLWPTAQERTFPDWKALVPKFKRGSAGTATFALNPGLLHKMANAMGVGGVALTIKLDQPQGKPSSILVTPLIESAEEMGLLMPMSLSGTDETPGHPDASCPACGKLLAPGASCPKHGTPAEARSKLLDEEASNILREAGEKSMARKELTGPAEKFRKGRG